MHSWWSISSAPGRPAAQARFVSATSRPLRVASDSWTRTFQSSISASRPGEFPCHRHGALSGWWIGLLRLDGFQGRVIFFVYHAAFGICRYIDNTAITHPCITCIWSDVIHLREQARARSIISRDSEFQQDYGE